MKAQIEFRKVFFDKTLKKWYMELFTTRFGAGSTTPFEIPEKVAKEMIEEYDLVKDDDEVLLGEIDYIQPFSKSNS